MNFPRASLFRIFGSVSCTVVVLRARGGRTLPFVFKAEDDSLPTIRERVEVSRTILGDEAGFWDGLHAPYEAKRVNFVNNEARATQAKASSRTCTAPGSAPTTTLAAST